MSRKLSMFLHGAAIVIGQMASGNLLGLAAKAFGWSEDLKDFWIGVAFAVQGGVQGYLAFIAQGYNTDGSKPGEVLIKTTTNVPVETTVTEVSATKKVE